mmetsp:Transcript_5133/g.14352  ORF Transcript_5133/g.14352 Transcript_5133/m.14352 type:complete len:174 (-) Transcript_5133:73-594(-)
MPAGRQELLGFPAEAVSGSGGKPVAPVVIVASSQARSPELQLARAGTENDAAIARALADQERAYHQRPLSSHTIPQSPSSASDLSSPTPSDCAGAAVMEHLVDVDSSPSSESPEVIRHEDDAEAMVTERFESVPRHSFTRLSDLRVNMPASFWEAHITEDRQRVIERLENYGV